MVDEKCNVFTGAAASSPASKEESDAAERRVGIRSRRIVIDHLLVGRLEHQVGRWEDGEAGGVELGLAGSRRSIQIGSGKAAGLQVLVGVAVGRHGLPFAAPDG